VNQSLTVPVRSCNYIGRKTPAPLVAVGADMAAGVRHSPRWTLCVPRATARAGKQHLFAWEFLPPSVQLGRGAGAGQVGKPPVRRASSRRKRPRNGPTGHHIPHWAYGCSTARSTELPHSRGPPRTWYGLRSASARMASDYVGPPVPGCTSRSGATPANPAKASAPSSTGPPPPPLALLSPYQHPRNAGARRSRRCPALTGEVQAPHPPKPALTRQLGDLLDESLSGITIRPPRFSPWFCFAMRGSEFPACGGRIGWAHAWNCSAPAARPA